MKRFLDKLGMTWNKLEMTLENVGMTWERSGDMRKGQVIGGDGVQGLRDAT